MPKFLDKGIEIHPLLESDIFSYKFDFDEWPSTHTVQDSFIRPYNGSIFELRNAYSEVFHEDKFKNLDTNDDGKLDKYEAMKSENKIDTSKIYKVSYSLNCLPWIEKYCVKGVRGPKGELVYENEDISLMNAFYESDELDIFES